MNGLPTLWPVTDCGRSFLRPPEERESRQEWQERCVYPSESDIESAALRRALKTLQVEPFAEQEREILRDFIDSVIQSLDENLDKALIEYLREIQPQLNSLEISIGKIKKMVAYGFTYGLQDTDYVKLIKNAPSSLFFEDLLDFIKIYQHFAAEDNGIFDKWKADLLGKVCLALISKDEKEEALEIIHSISDREIYKASIMEQVVDQFLDMCLGEDAFKLAEIMPEEDDLTRILQYTANRKERCLLLIGEFFVQTSDWEKALEIATLHLQDQETVADLIKVLCLEMARGGFVEEAKKLAGRMPYHREQDILCGMCTVLARTQPGEWPATVALANTIGSVDDLERPWIYQSRALLEVCESLIECDLNYFEVAVELTETMLDPNTLQECACFLDFFKPVCRERGIDTSCLKRLKYRY